MTKVSWRSTPTNCCATAPRSGGDDLVVDAAGPTVGLGR
jgi:hypothetical protein